MQVSGLSTGMAPLPTPHILRNTPIGRCFKKPELQTIFFSLSSILVSLTTTEHALIFVYWSSSSSADWFLPVPTTYK